MCEYYGVTTPTDDFIAHWGVKGMKWGIRKARPLTNGRPMSRSEAYQKAQKKLDDIVYIGLRKYFPRFNPADGAPELIKRLKDNGVKIVFLSDFPPEQKGDIWGLKQYCDLCFTTEEYGALNHLLLHSTKWPKSLV